MAYRSTSGSASWACTYDSTAIMINIKFYGMMQEKYGKSRLDIEAGTVRDALNQVARTAAEEKQLRECVMFVNGKPLRGAARLAAKLRDGDELALLPPVSGG